jgi:hypothetical protein
MKYNPISEKPYCCVPAVLQMIQARRSLPMKSQEEIGWELGLIVPSRVKQEFAKVRTGPEPRAGYGTQTSRPEFSIERYFDRNQLPLSIQRVFPSSCKEMITDITTAFVRDDDVILCFNSQLLLGDGDMEHVSLIEEFDCDTSQLTIVDPVIGVPNRRNVPLVKAFETIQNHIASDIGGLWIVSERIMAHNKIV